ncbi:MAG: group 1 glycosyl transferase [Bacteroidetes bacterium]|nr:MAG: group 1 glycosyl transferase [Bacteroidota bacterium]
MHLVSLHDSPVHPDAEKELKKYCREILFIPLPKSAVFFNLLRGFFSPLPMQVAYFNSPRAHREIGAFIEKHRPDRIFCQLIRTTEFVRSRKDIPKILDYMDVFSKGIERRIGKVNFLSRPVFRMEHRRLLKYEREIFSDFEERIIISAQDRDLVDHPEKNKIRVIANGVDTGFFRPLPAEKKHELLFNGNMNYPPNVESAEYLVTQVLPLVHQKNPGVRVLISGASPSPRILALKSASVTVSGWVDDVRDSFTSSRILVAPMQSSIGLQNKLLEAMAMRMPCITTTLSNNALGAVSGEQILVADSPQTFADQILFLLANPGEAEKIAEAGHRFIMENFNWKKQNLQLAEIIGNAGKK